MINVNKSKRGGGGNSLNQKKLSKKIQRIYRQAFVYFLWIRKWGRAPRKFIIDTDRKLVYLNNPKVACSSIKKSMFGDQPDIHDFVNPYTEWELNRETGRYYKFTFVKINAYSIRMIFAGTVICLAVCCVYVISTNLYTGYFYFPVVWPSLILPDSTCWYTTGAASVRLIISVRLNI